MFINRIVVENYKAISRLELNDLKQMVVIAGPNGCGKSCVFDAIRLLKSVYGGYQPNEISNWFGEQQIQLDHNTNVGPLLKDKNAAFVVELELTLSDSEIDHLKHNLSDIVTTNLWRQIAPGAANWASNRSLPIATETRIYQKDVERRAAKQIPSVKKQLRGNSFTGRIEVSLKHGIVVEPSLVLELVFGNFDPANIGIIDFHGPNRVYAREQLGSINLRVDQAENKLKQHALYNIANKYSNLKQELAGTFVRGLIADQASDETGSKQFKNLTETLAELFRTFFPGKTFLGVSPTPEGTVEFPVMTDTGEIHDIDELSSGEKELVYGYLRLKNSAPQNSILLLDEPELHLNPRLQQGLVSFYRKHLGLRQDNQLWLVTHSDTLLREAVSQENYSVFHMQVVLADKQENQAVRVEVGEDVDRAIIDLIGDLAAYKPGAKIVVFEGGGDSEFDVRMVSTIFPEFPLQVNMISGGDKKRVRDLYALLEKARQNGITTDRYYAIVDSDDSSDPSSNIGLNIHEWDVYHIENYLVPVHKRADFR